jgi:hypothetical protein
VEMSIFSQNIVKVRPTNIMSRAKTIGPILKNNFNKNWSPSPIQFKEFFGGRFDQFSTLKNDQNFEMFKEVVHDFGKFDVDII